MVAKHTIAIATTVLFQAVVGSGQKKKNERITQNATTATARWAKIDRRASNARVRALIPDSSETSRWAGR
jgi:hypothetical protein